VTVKERVDLVERQRSIAWAAIHQELSNFSSLLHQLSSMGYTSDIHEVLERVAGMVPFLKETTNQLSASSESLGAVRQETRVSDLVSLMADYVVVLTEKYDLLHLQLLDARQLIDKNHIVIERDKVDKGPTKCRSISLVCPPTPTSTVDERRISLVKQDDKNRHSEDLDNGGALPLSQGGEEVQTGGTSTVGPVRKRTKKLSMFETIEENQDCSPPSALITSPRKSSKKVSIAENLNCDYWDWEYSELDETEMGDHLEEQEENTRNTSRSFTSFLSSFFSTSLTTFLLELIVTVIFVLVSYTVSYPKQAAVIFLSLGILYLLFIVLS